MTGGRDWLDEQMDEADYWYAVREARHDVIEAMQADLPDEEEDDDDD